MGPLVWLALIALGWWWGRKDRPSCRGGRSIGVESVSGGRKDVFPRCVPEVRGAHQDTQLLPFARPRWMDQV